jgi:quercetin dioxygenase-like cupin family protein
MPVITEDSSTKHEIHGSVFHSYVTSHDGSSLCAWRLSVPPGVEGVAHRPDRDEVLLVLEGAMRATVNGTQSRLAAGGVLLVQAGDELKVDTGCDGVTAWVTTTAGLTATMPDGSRLAPPWAQ